MISSESEINNNDIHIDPQYKDKESFVDDVKLIFSNTRMYNQPETVYYRASNDLESFINPYLNSLKFDKCGFAPDNVEEEEKKDSIQGVKKKISKNK